ncbi:hypothetical protein SERLA73DRAFT_67928 [Serpula lacrymans var. lacrymans S7.3]|uniref:Uncharacterized protein n=1 Tax=Serpula lacrymans var. lacrymans (strain S7.3) TaxID=936435 RepID=F8PFB1_SERL3|nr:hypothetical protein SERLA73DRAFT_67928 [Serpula lacrymans var. lacrymans S7.3]
MHHLIIHLHCHLSKRPGTSVLLALLLATSPYTLPNALKLLASSRPWPNLLAWLPHFRAQKNKSQYDTYATREDEDRYWRSAARSRRRLAASDAHLGGNTPTVKRGEGGNDASTLTSTPVPLVAYYTPRLLPSYRDTEGETDLEAEPFHIPARTFCKWHRMVFPGPHHPTLSEAPELMKRFSHRDLQEIQRISHLQADSDVFQRRLPWTPRYRTVWNNWLDSKGPDIAIVFE